jgi:hypothetical protein
MGRHRINPGTDSAKSTTVVVYSAKRRVDPSEIEKMQKWLELRMKTTDIVLVGKDQQRATLDNCVSDFSLSS